MAATKTADEIQSETFEWLKGTRYASTSLEPLSGGGGNFVYRARLSHPLENGARDVIVKHGEGYVAAYPANASSTVRCRIEGECLKELVAFRINGSEVDASKFVVRTPECYLYDEATNTQIQEYLPNGTNLKAYALANFPSPTPKALESHCHQLGKALAQYVSGFHAMAEKEVKEWATGGSVEPEPKLYALLKDNKDMQRIRHMTLYTWLIRRVDMFPSVLEEARETFMQIKAQADEELEDRPDDLMPTHGDFWTANIVLPNAPIEEGKHIPVFVVDWEMAHLGVPNADYGLTIGGLYELWLLRKIDAGLWIVQGFAEGLGQQTIASAWRTTLHVGIYLLSFGTVIPGQGTPEQVEHLARVGRDIVVHAWRKDREWVEKSELACLFIQVKWE